MVGGMNRTRPPRELARDPEAWPQAEITDPGAAVIQHISRALTAALTERGLSLRKTADGSGVNRQAIADLAAGRCWPDIATVARLENFLDITLYPPGGGTLHRHAKPAFSAPATACRNDESGNAAPEASIVALTSGDA